MLFFSFCVQTMHVMADFTGLTYKEINTIIFLILEPGLVILFVVLWLLEKDKNKRLSRKKEDRQQTLG